MLKPTKEVSQFLCLRWKQSTLHFYFKWHVTQERTKLCLMTKNVVKAFVRPTFKTRTDSQSSYPLRTKHQYAYTVQSVSTSTGNSPTHQLSSRMQVYCIAMSNGGLFTFYGWYDDTSFWIKIIWKYYLYHVTSTNRDKTKNIWLNKPWYLAWNVVFLEKVGIWLVQQQSKLTRLNLLLLKLC